MPKHRVHRNSEGAHVVILQAVTLQVFPRPVNSAGLHYATSAGTCTGPAPKRIFARRPLVAEPRQKPPRACCARW